MSILKDLYFGNIQLNEVPSCSEYEVLMDKLIKKCDELKEKFDSDELKKLFNEYEDINNQLLTVEMYDRFKKGFALGLNFKDESNDVIKELDSTGNE